MPEHPVTPAAAADSDAGWMAPTPLPLLPDQRLHAVHAVLRPDGTREVHYVDPAAPAPVRPGPAGPHISRPLIEVELAGTAPTHPVRATDPVPGWAKGVAVASAGIGAGAAPVLWGVGQLATPAAAASLQAIAASVATCAAAVLALGAAAVIVKVSATVRPTGASPRGRATATSQARTSGFGWTRTTTTTTVRGD